MLRILLFIVPAALIFLALSPCLTAEETATQPDGLSAGDPLGAFMVTKVAGAEDDGVEPGQQLCYRCRYGRNPMVMIFTRSASGSLSKFVRRLDSIIESKRDSRLQGFVTMIGGDTNDLTKKAEKMAKDVNAKNVPIVVAKDHDRGPVDYLLNEDTEVTVIIVNYSQVVTRLDFAADQIDIDDVIDEVSRMLN